MEFSRSSPLQQITLYSSYAARESFFRSRGRRQRSFFDRESPIFRQGDALNRGQPHFVFFFLLFSFFLSFFFFFRTILLSASRSNIYGASFLLLLTMMRRGATPPYPLRRAFKAPPREPLSSCSCGHFLSLRFLFGEYLSNGEVDARVRCTKWRTMQRRKR